MSHDLNESSLNTSVIDTSSFRAEDFALFMDCLENIGTKNTTEKVKKTRKSRSRANRVKDSDAGAVLNKTTGCDLGGKRWAPSYFSSCYNLNDAAVHDQSALTDITCSTINQTINDNIDASVISEQFNLNEVFAYFNEDIDKTRFDDSDSNDDSAKVDKADAEKENVAKNASPKEKPARNARPKRVTHEAKSKTMLAPIHSSSDSERDTPIFKRPNAVPLGRKIIVAAKKPNAKLPAVSDVPDNNRLSRTMNDAPATTKQTQRYSSASTLSLHESDSDSVAQKNATNDDGGGTYVAPNVREKISFFNQTINERSASPATLSTLSAPPSALPSEDEEYQFQREKSKRKFQQKREFFEKIFSERLAGDKQSSVHPSNTPKPHALTHEQKLDKLEAVEAYVQTKYLLERIQMLTKAISNMDEAQCQKMDLKKLKKFLLFIRDCSYKCQQVCFEISENFLTDFEKNVMSVEELLFSALKAVHMPQKV